MWSEPRKRGWGGDRRNEASKHVEKANRKHLPHALSPPDAGPPCEHTSCQSCSNFLYSHWESQLEHSSCATVSLPLWAAWFFEFLTYWTPQLFVQALTANTHRQRIAFVVVLHPPLARGRYITAYFPQRDLPASLVRSLSAEDTRLFHLLRRLSFIVLVFQRRKMRRAISVMASNEMAHACLWLYLDARATWGGKKQVMWLCVWPFRKES